MLQHVLQRLRCSASSLSAASFVLLFTLPLQAAEPEPDLRLTDDIVPVSQKIHLIVDARRPDYEGSVSVSLDARKPVSVFHLHGELEEITDLRLTRGSEEIEVEHRVLGIDVIQVTAKSALELGEYRLDIRFKNDFDTKALSLYRAEAAGDYYTFTQFEAVDARKAFPCWDEPRFKIPYQMTLTVPTVHEAVSNMPVVEQSEADGLRTLVYAESPPMPSYLLALATGPFDSVEMSGLGTADREVPGRIYTVKGKSDLTSMAVEVTPTILKALEEYFGSPYPYPKLDFIAVPEFWPGAMENPGAVTYVDRLLIVDPSTATLGQRRSQAVVIAHELAHQWFGNLVTMEWWDDLWLNESFADWMADKITHQLFPDYGVDVSNTVSGQRIMVTDAAETSVAIRRPITSTQTIMQDLGLAYSKGKSVLAMYESWLGEETFRRGVLDYLQAREWRNATADDLFEALSKASGKPLKQSLATFIDQPGVPRVAVGVDGGKLRLTQKRFRNHGSKSKDQLWQIPIVLKYGVGDRIEEKVVLLDGPSLNVDLGLESSPDWIFPNGDARGYFRWSLGEPQMKALLEQGLSRLQPVERINLISNVTAGLSAGELDGGSFLTVLSQMAGDPEPLVVRSVLGGVYQVDEAFVPEDLEGAYQAWLRQTFKPVLSRLGEQRRPGEPETTAQVRSSLLSLLVQEAKDPELVDRLAQSGRSFLKDPASVDPNLVFLALNVVASHGDAELFDLLQKKAESAELPRMRSAYLSALGSFEDETLQRRAMDYALGKSVRPNELFTVVQGISRSDGGRDKMFRFIIDNWKVLGEKLPPQFRSFMPQMAGGCSKERLKLAEGFFGVPEHQGPGVDRSMTKLRESVGNCIGLRDREGESVREFFASYGDG